jgi:ketosteroid isomerase-like protein
MASPDPTMTGPALLTTLAAAWNSADPEAAVRCFSTDVVYVEPPDRQRYVGHQEIYELSAATGMSMTWHHVAFDPDTQIGFAGDSILLRPVSPAPRRRSRASSASG